MPLIWVVFRTMLTFKNPLGSGLLPLPAALHKLAQLQAPVHGAELISLDAFKDQRELLQLERRQILPSAPAPSRFISSSSWMVLVASTNLMSLPNSARNHARTICGLSLSAVRMFVPSSHAF